MRLSPGARLGVYEIYALAGAGGMGEVYRARDTRLNRDVALKVLPSAFALDPERLARFQREAQILASIGHPNIAGIFGVEHGDGVNALVLEYVEGPTLAELIGAKPLPCDDALALARQIAEALEAAHERGIVHRDLKPANIKVLPRRHGEGARFRARESDRARVIRPRHLESPTITSPAVTAAGVILGTAAYMSPEQARGRSVDKRTDNWAFGCLLYEMLTGVRAFRADTVTDTLAAIVRSEPDTQALPAGLPPAIGLLLKRCLEKDVRRRLRDIGEARIAIENVIGGHGEPGPIATEAKRSSRRALLTLAMGLAMAAAVIAGAVVWRFARTDAAPVARLSVVPPADAPLAGQSIAITPDGRHIVYVSGNGTQLSVRALGEARAASPHEPRTAGSALHLARRALDWLLRWPERTEDCAPHRRPGRDRVHVAGRRGKRRDVDVGRRHRIRDRRSGNRPVARAGARRHAEASDHTSSWRW